MIGWVLKKILGTQNQREVRRMMPLVQQINEWEGKLRPLSLEELRAKTNAFRERIAKGESVDSILPEAFAVVKNCCRRFTEEANEAQRDSEMEAMYQEYQASHDVVVAVTLRSNDDLFKMMCAMSAARVEEISK